MLAVLISQGPVLELLGHPEGLPECSDTKEQHCRRPWISEVSQDRLSTFGSPFRGTKLVAYES